MKHSRSLVRTLRLVPWRLFLPGCHQRGLRLLLSALLVLSQTPDRLTAAAGNLSIPGSLKVVLQPAEAVAAGAAWAVDGGEFRESGFQLLPLDAGSHPITLRDVPGWLEPETTEVLIIGGRETQLTLTYSPAPSYYFREIPDQRVRSAAGLELWVTTDNPDDPQNPGPGTPLQIEATPSPAGSLNYDSATGRLRYVSAAADRLPFRVQFRTTQGVSGSFEITPFTPLAPEDAVLAYDRALPDETSRDYLQISEVPQGDGAFNDSTAQTFEVSISGHTLVFGEGHPAGLHRQFNNRRNIRKLNLYADTILITSPFLLPQTEVTIHARELRFEGEGQIDTTPLKRNHVPAAATWENELTAGTPGDPGHPGGDVQVLVERFSSNPTEAIRFVLNGGDGGPAGDGRDGKPETELEYLSPDWHKLMGRAGITVCDTLSLNRVITYFEARFNDVIQETCGTKGAVRGESAVPSGSPGAGGRGGTLRSTLNLTPYAQFKGGVAGARARDHQGAVLSPDTRYLRRLALTRIVQGEDQTRNEDTVLTKLPGTNSVAPANIGGADGQAEVVPNPASWLHSFGVRSVVNYAKDAYLNGRIEETRRLLQEYQQLVLAHHTGAAAGALLAGESFSEDVNLSQLQGEIANLLHRLDSNLDYFGNPAGWVPMLSFESNLLAFQNEINHSIPILYLAYWLNQAATNLQASLSASEEARQGLLAERDQLEAQYNDAQLAIPRLQEAARDITQRIDVLKTNLEVKLDTLEKRARRNVQERHRVPFWKKAAGALAIVADLVPVGQPVVGQVGKGLELLSKFDTKKPIESARSLAPQALYYSTNVNITYCFNTNALPTNRPAGKLASAIASGEAGLAGDDEPHEETREERLKRYSDCGSYLDGQLQELAGIFRTAQVDDEELSAELDKLKAADQEFAELTEQAEKLGEEKQRFAEELASALQEVGAFTTSLSQNLVATHELEDSIGANLDVLNHGALMHIKAMERRARDRMLQYHYVLAKSFQYRQLRPFSGNLNLNRLFTQFQRLIEKNTSHHLSLQDFDLLKGIYISELRDLVALSLDNGKAPPRTLSKNYRLNAQQRQQLNEQGYVLLNLKDLGLISPGDENVRLSDLTTKTLITHATGPIGSLAIVRVTYEHQGVSRLTSGGRTWLFRHYQTEQSNPITWSALYDGQTGQTINSKLSPAEESLIGVLLSQQSTPVTDILLYSQPAANADILLTKQVNTDNGTDFVIDDLLFEITYDFSPTRSNLRELVVKVSNDLQPVIAINRSDINSRQDGQGDFNRVFNPLSTVGLEAPKTYGRYTFDRWLINNQPQASTEPKLSLLMLNDTQVEARYRIAAKPLVLIPLSPTPGQLRFEFESELGSSYVLEVSGTLATPGWGVLERRAGTGERLQFSLPTGAADAGFFRVRVE